MVKLFANRVRERVAESALKKVNLRLQILINYASKQNPQFPHDELLGGREADRVLVFRFAMLNLFREQSPRLHYVFVELTRNAQRRLIRLASKNRKDATKVAGHNVADGINVKKLLIFPLSIRPRAGLAEDDA